MMSAGCKKDDYASKDDLKKLQEKVDKQDKGSSNDGVKTKQFTVTFGPNKYNETVYLNEIMNNSQDIVLVFVQGTEQEWSPIPVLLGYNINVQSEIEVRYMVTSFRSVEVALWQASEQKPFYSPNPLVLNFKAVVIPVSSIQANPGVDLNDYQAVQEAFLGEE